MEMLLFGVVGVARHDERPAQKDMFFAFQIILMSGPQFDSF